MKRNVILLFCSLSICMMSACDKKKEEQTELVRPVKYLVLKDKQSKILRSFPGVILPNQNTLVSFEVAGRVMNINVLKGDKVTKGQELANLDPSKYQDDVDLASARYRETLAQFKRGEALIKDAYISRSDYDKLKSNMEITKARLNTAQTNLSYTKVHAPFDGIVARRFVEKFDQVQAKQNVLDIHDISNVDIEIDIPENIVIHFKAMESANNGDNEERPRVYFEAKPNVSYPLEFKEFTSEADPNTQTYAIRFTMPQPKDIVVLPGMNVTVKAWIPDVSGTPQEFNLIPSAAVFADEDKKSSVWIIDMKTMEVHKRNIEVSKLTGDRIRVLNGLKAGDHVVTAGVHFLREGQKVKLFELPAGKEPEDKQLSQEKIKEVKKEEGV